MNKMIWQDEGKAGLVIGNSTISCDVSHGGRMYRRILYNPPCFEMGKNELSEAGQCGFSFAVDGKVKKDCNLTWVIEEKTYPRYIASAELSKDISIKTEAFCPIAVNDAEVMFTPCAITEYTVTNSSNVDKTVKISLQWHPTKNALGNSFCRHNGIRCIKDGHYIIEQGDAFMSVFGCNKAEDGYIGAKNGVFTLVAEVSVGANSSSNVVFLLGIFEPMHRLRTKFLSCADVCLYVENTYSKLKYDINEFISCVPNTGNEEIYKYTRWYMQAAILLTKSACTGEVITMGYNELNQRDSFWTSYVHLSLWPSLEKEILRISARWMRTDGKIPTTVLPRIERNFDIDINEYFCLRIARYFKYHKDHSFLEEMYDSYKKSVDFILSCDIDGDLIPDQQPPHNSDCFWADWKDVAGVVGRKYAPHFCLLWLAVLKEGIDLANEMNDEQTADKYSMIYSLVYSKLNLDLKDGGLWDVDHYAETWYDGRHMTEILQDQTVGLIYGVVPEERIPLIYEALARGENEFGIRETFPYRPNFGYAGGDYHNGGIWPYLMFCDIMGRYINGYSNDAERLICKVGYHDLVASGDFSPNEYMQGDTGENRGMEIQGWSSALYGAITHGAFGIEHTADKEITVTVRFKDRDFETVLMLPKNFGKVLISRKNGVIMHSEPKNKNYKISVIEK